MAVAAASSEPLEHLWPHDLVAYSRCPHEMELEHQHRIHPGAPTRTPVDCPPLRHSPLFLPPGAMLPVVDGRPDVFPADRLVYEDKEEGLPMLFPEEQIESDPRFHAHGLTLSDETLGLSGRPDFVIRRASGTYHPVEYKATHPFPGLHGTHGRGFDVIQLFAECRLVAAVTGTIPATGILFYGDEAGDGEHEAWVEVSYGVAGDTWLRAALHQVRADAIRAPVPSETTCGHCLAHREGLCRFAFGTFRG